MLPAQTSMMPVVVALTRFMEEGSNVWGLYPYWYLGTTPYHYLTGPILPAILVFLHRLFPQLSLFDIMFGLTATAWVIGGSGVYWLIKELGHSRSGPLARFSPFLAAFFYLFGPLMPFLFRFSDGLSLISFSLLPYILWVYAKKLASASTRKIKFDILIIFLTSFLLLLDTSLIISLILGLIAVLLAETGWREIENKLKNICLLIIIPLCLVTFWYTPGYWGQLFIAPSFAGQPFYRVLSQLGQLLPLSLALGLAVIAGKKWHQKSRAGRFAFYWLFIFGFLTLMRFLADPDFWQDWTAYSLEIQLGLGILGGLIVTHLLKGQKSQISNLKTQNYNLKLKTFSSLTFLIVFYLLSFVFVFNKYILMTLQKDVTQSVEYQIGTQLARITKPGEKVFLSGTTAFWLNAFFDIPQVRGGVDQASVDPSWRQAVWEIREGEDVDSAVKWLKELQVNYLVVHTQDSKEFYHDFRFPDKFEGMKEVKKIYEKEGDIIYQVWPE